MSAGLTRIMFEMMDQRISQAALSDITGIPKPTLSQYCNGVRTISRNHLPILAIALDVRPLTALLDPTPLSRVFVVDNELLDDNPFFYRRRTTF